MAAIRTIAVCYPQVPFFTGGAELLVRSLCEQLEQRGYQAEPVSIPFRWTPSDALQDQLLAWRMLDLRNSNGVKIDRVIATKFPSYAVEHPNKVTWLVHQFRQLYDLYGTEYSDYGRQPEHMSLREMIRRADCKTLTESRRIYAISKEVAKRLMDFNAVSSEPLYHPPPRHERFKPGPAGDYVLSVGRLESAKRVEFLVRAMPHTDPSLRCVICGSGPEEASLRALAEMLGVADRIHFAGAVPFRDLVALYSNCLAVYFAPFQEDYGYVTLESFLSGKPVVTAPDAGGPTEFVLNDETGFVVELESEKLAERLRRLAEDRTKSAEMGRAGLESIADIGWDETIEKLVAP
jgi:glycosyltransferase involved in cell wall biosynthesis